MRIDWKEVEKRANGRLVVLGFGFDRIAGIFSSVKKAVKASGKASGFPRGRAWWLEFRRIDHLDDVSVFQRVLLRSS